MGAKIHMEYKNLETLEIKNLIRELQNELQLRVSADKQKLLAEIRQKANDLDIPVENLLEEAKLKKKRVCLSETEISKSRWSQSNMDGRGENQNGLLINWILGIP